MQSAPVFGCICSCTALHCLRMAPRLDGKGLGSISASLLFLLEGVVARSTMHIGSQIIAGTPKACNASVSVDNSAVMMLGTRSRVEAAGCLSAPLEQQGRMLWESPMRLS